MNDQQPIINRPSITSLLYGTNGTLVDRLKNPQQTEMIRNVIASVQQPTTNSDIGGMNRDRELARQKMIQDRTSTDHPSFLKGIAQGITRGVVQTAAAFGQLGSEVLDTVETPLVAGFARAVGNKDKADQIMKARNERLAGAQTPQYLPGGAWTGGKTNPIDTIPEAWGRAFQLGSLLGVSSVANAVATNTMRGAILSGALSGATTGATAGVLGGAGNELVDDKNPTFTKTATSGLTGGLVGGIAGGVLGGVGGALGYTARKAAQYAKDWSEGKLPSQQPQEVRTAIKQQIDPVDVAYVHNMSPEDKLAAAKMLAIKGEVRTPGVVPQRPEQIAGQTIIDKVNHLWDARKAVGTELGTAIKSMPNTPQDVTGVFNNFVSQLNDAGVQVDYKGNLDFSNSIFDTASGAKDQTLLQGIFSKLRPQDVPTDKLHEIAQNILESKSGAIGPQSFDTVLPESYTVTKTPKQLDLMVKSLFDDLGLGDKTDVFTNRAIGLGTEVRSGLRQALQDLSPQYNEAATKYAQIYNTLDEFYSLIGKKWSGKSGDMLALRAGEVGNRALSNASAGALDVIGNVEKVAAANGYTKNTSAIDQLYVADMLENYFGSTQTRSLAGQVQRGTSGALEQSAGVIHDITTRNVPKLIMKGVNAVKGVNEASQKKALLQLMTH